MTIGVLAVQGAFAEHIKRLKELGIDSVELRKKDDLGKPFDGIILPGGESTVQGKLLREDVIDHCGTAHTIFIGECIDLLNDPVGKDNAVNALFLHAGSLPSDRVKFDCNKSLICN